MFAPTAFSRRRTFSVSHPGFSAFLLVLVFGMSACEPTDVVGEDGERATGSGPAALADSYIATEVGAGRFALAASGSPAALYVSADDFPGVIRAVRDLQTDLGRVAGATPELSTDALPEAETVVLIGTLGKSPTIDQLAEAGKIEVADVQGRWEAFSLQVVDEPLPGVAQALVIVGSDQRGTTFGVYDLIEKIGVSPWHWWADVPVEAQPDLYVLPGPHTDAPVVRYRGIFLNDENPALYGWVNETFGGFNHQFYEHVFNLILRLKGNYLWPAMWGKAIYDDDPRSPALADEMGVVIGTSHHEPLMRAHVEWERYGSGEWNYMTNPDTLRAFWRHGIERMGDNESLVTIGMRGDGDEAMTEGTAIDLLERIVADQRQIIADVTGKDPATVPQVWALYKEVQDYYDQGMEVPDDVTLLFADDNWGNIRRLPDPNAAPRAGGYGVYYHFDYVGGPRNYKWINVTQIERVWEQMHLAHEYGANQIWIVNVGDLKPMEFPIDFFLDYAWNPDDWPVERLPEYTRHWAAQQFGEAHADEIAHLLEEYTRFNSRRTPEMLEPGTYSLHHFREAETVVDDYNALAAQAERINDALPEAYRDAFFQLVLFPVQASANLNELYVTVAKNRWYAEQGRAATNELAEKARALYARDAELTRQYHEDLADGKWNHMMSQVHIGYTYWQQPPEQTMPEVEEIDVPAGAEMGVSIEGSAHGWPASGEEAALPAFDVYHQQTRYIDVFNRGREVFDFTVSAEPWVSVAPSSGTVDTQQRLDVRIDWDAAPAGTQRVPITISGPDDTSVVVYAEVVNPESPGREEVEGFVESNGYVSMEAAHYTNAVGQGDITWSVIEGLGRTLSAVTAFPVTAESQTPAGDSPHLEYQLYLTSAGEVTVHAYLSPSFDFRGTDGLRYAVSFDDAAPQIVNMHPEGSLSPDTYHPAWSQMVADNILVSASTHVLDTPGAHVLKFWMVDPGVVLQKLVVETGDLPSTYLGPPESYNRAFTNNP